MNIGNMLFKDIAKPARYVGGEVNQVIKEKKDIKCNVALCYPNIYEKAMSNHVINMLYININNIKDVYCTRSFSPDIDFEKLLREKNCNIYSLENFESIKYSDILVFVLTSELEFTNFLNMLELAGINKDSKDRISPKVVAVSNGKVNTKILNKYVDVFFNEESDIANVKKVVKYLENYSNANMENIEDFENVKLKSMAENIIPSIKIENSSIMVDLSNIDKIEDLIEDVRECIEKRGINQVSFVNYDKISENLFCEVIYRLKMNIDGIRIYTKNIDFNRFSPKILNVILPCTEKSSLVFNVDTCNLKAISNDIADRNQIIERVKNVFKNGRSSIKLMFNIGLPNETFEDIDNIFDLAEEVVNIYSEFKAKDKLSITVCVNIYVPTTKEIEQYNMGSVTKLDTKIRYINEKKSDPVIKWKVENVDRYITKLLLKNGKEDVAKILESAYVYGARFDDDVSKYNKEAWEKAILENSDIVKKYINNR